MSEPRDADVAQRSVVILHDGHDEASRTYAEWLAEDTGGTVGTVAAADAQEGELGAALLVADTVVVVASLGASDGTVAGAEYVNKHWDFLHDFGRRLAMGVVGLTPVFDYGRLTALEEALGAEKMTQIKFFQLRGKLDTSRLGMRDKLALRAQVAALRARPRRAPDEQAMLDNGGNFDYTNRKSLGPLLRWVRGES